MDTTFVFYTSLLPWVLCLAEELLQATTVSAIKQCPFARELTLPGSVTPVDLLRREQKSNPRTLPTIAHQPFMIGNDPPLS